MQEKFSYELFNVNGERKAVGDITSRVLFTHYVREYRNNLLPGELFQAYVNGMPYLSDLRGTDAPRTTL